MGISLKLVKASRLISFRCSSRKQVKPRFYSYKMIFYYGSAVTTTRSWQRSWALGIEYNASVGRGWTALLRAVTNTQDTEPWQTLGTALGLDSPPPPAWKESETGKPAYICRFNLHHLYGLSISPDWYCEGAGIDEGTACPCPLGSRDEYIWFPPPDVCWKKSNVVNKLWGCDRSLTLTGFMEHPCYCHLSQEVLLRVLVERRHCTTRPKPGVNSNIVFISFAKAAIIREADIFLQLWYLRQHSSNKIPPREHLKLIPFKWLSTYISQQVP